MPMAGDEPVHRSDEAVDDRQPAETREEPEARDDLGDAEDRIGAGPDRSVVVDHVERGREVA
jgi:hypothetical protein